VDSGADISLVKSYKLLEISEFEPKDRIRVKSVEGSFIETHGSIETRIRGGGMDIPFYFQLVSKHVGLKGDGILGRDILNQRRPEFLTKNDPWPFDTQVV